MKKAIFRGFIIFALFVFLTACSDKQTGSIEQAGSIEMPRISITNDNMVHIPGGTFLMGRYVGTPETNPYTASSKLIVIAINGIGIPKINMRKSGAANPMIIAYAGPVMNPQISTGICIGARAIPNCGI